MRLVSWSLLTFWIVGCQPSVSTPTPTTTPSVQVSVSATPQPTPTAVASASFQSSGVPTRAPARKKLKARTAEEPTIEGDGGAFQAEKSRQYDKRRIQGSIKADTAIVEAVLNNKQCISDTMQARAFVLGIQALLESGQYDRLEQLADLYLEDSQRLSDGKRKSTIFYYALKMPRNPKQSFHHNLLHEWMKARPSSTLPRVAMARQLLDVEEGEINGAFDSLPKPLSDYYTNPLPTARKLLLEAASLRPDSDIYALMIDVVRREGGSIEDAQKYLDLADAIDPLNYHQEAQFARLLFHRGQDWRQALSKDENAYFVVASYLKKPQRPPRELLAYYQATEKRFPNSALIKNQIAQVALRARNEEVAAKAFAALGDRAEIYAWSPEEFYEKRNGLEAKGYKVRTGKSLPLPKAVSEISLTGVSDDLLRLQAEELLSREHYAELDALAGIFRAKKAKGENGFSKVSLLFDGFTSEFFDNHAKGWQLSLWADRWMRLSPTSVTAQELAVVACVKEAWDVRGSGYADTVSEKQWEGFRERLELGWSYIEELEAQSAAKDAKLYSTALTIGMGLGFDKDQQEALLAKAASVDKNEPAPYVAMATYLLPRWSGSERELEAFLQTVPAIPFPQVASSVAEDIDIKDPRYLAKFSQGASALARQHPTSKTWSQALFLAAAAGDRKAGREAVANLGGVWQGDNIRTPVQYKKLVAWSQGAALNTSR